MENKKVSVIMSCLNTPRDYLQMAVESILNQTYKNIEFIIVNNGGNNYQDLVNYQKSDNRIVIINNENTLDLPSALNMAMEKSEGFYIARMDSDDYSLPDRIENQVLFLEKNPNICICSMYARLFGAENKFMIYPWTSPRQVKASLFLSNELFHPSIMFRGDFVRNHDLKYDSRFCYSEDFELWNRCADLGDIAIVPMLGLLYRIHGESTSNKKNDIQRDSKEKVLLRNFKEFSNIDKYKDRFVAMSNNQLVGTVDENFEAIETLCADKSTDCKYDLECLRSFLMIKLLTLAIKNHEKIGIVSIIKNNILVKSRIFNYTITKIKRTIYCRYKYASQIGKIIYEKA